MMSYSQHSRCPEQHEIGILIAKFVARVAGITSDGQWKNAAKSNHRE
jgi:hypothetical protein